MMCCQGSFPDRKGGRSDFLAGGPEDDREAWERAVAMLRGGGNLNCRHILRVSMIWGMICSAF
eukprot:12630001-Prorocentrum_lima.AAC.1